MERKCEVCGDTAYHFPVGINDDGYCCWCYNSENPCPDEYCDSHNK